MSDFQPLNQVRTLASDNSGVSFFASQVVSLLADRSVKSVVEPREQLIEGLIAASLVGHKGGVFGLADRGEAGADQSGGAVGRVYPDCGAPDGAMPGWTTRCRGST